MHEITIANYYTISHDSYNDVWFAPCGRHESLVTTVSRIFSVSVSDIDRPFPFCSKYINSIYGSIFQEE